MESVARGLPGTKGGEEVASYVLANTPALRPQSVEHPAAPSSVRARTFPAFIGQESGASIVVPQGATGPLPANNGLGVKYVGGSGEPGLSPNAGSFRIIDPTLPAGPSPGYPTGYASYLNHAGELTR
jgi:hypothetical protein